MFERHLETKEFLTIPLSGNMYSIDINGQIKNTENEILETTLDADGNKVIWLSLWFGCAFYQVAMLVAHTFKPLHIPFAKWKELRVLFKDNNKENIHPSNLIWKFPIGLESSKYPGYAFIPGFTKYVINKNGELIQFFTGYKPVISVSRKNYVFYSVIPDIGKPTRVARHRLIGLAWLDYSSAVDKLQVNHINKQPGNDWLDNLEWVTNIGNINHSMIFNHETHEENIKNLNTEKGLISKNILTDEIIYYKNTKECCINNNININSLVFRLNNEKQSIYPDYLQFKYSDDISEWQEVNKDELKILLNSLDSFIVVRNALTKEIKEYPNVTSCSKDLNITYNNLIYRLSLNNQPLFPGYLQFQRKTILTKWREPKNLEQEHEIALHGRSVLMRNVLTNQVTEFSSARECAFSLGMCELAIAVRLRDKTQKVYPGNLQFKRKFDLSPWKEFTGDKKDFANGRYPIKVKIRDIFTNEEFIFNSINEASEDKNIPWHILMNRKDGTDNKPYFNFEIKFGDQEYEIYSDIDLLMFNKAIEENKPFRGRGFKLTDIASGEVRLYSSREQIVKEFGIAKCTVSEMAQDKRIFRKKWRFEYYFN